MILTLLTTSLSALAQPADVYLLAGQSNMQGAGILADLTEIDRAPIPAARYWTGKAFEPLTPGQTKLSNNLLRFGPELQFARRRAKQQPMATFYIVKYHASGQPLDRGMNRQEWLGKDGGPKRSNFYPGKAEDDPDMGACYRGMLNTMRAALADLDAQSIEYRVRGFLWMQGEADAKHEVPAKRYAQNLKDLHQRVLADLKLPPSRLVYGQVLPHSPPAPRFTHRDDLRQSQANADHASEHTDSYRWAFMVSTDEVDLHGDTVHYSSIGAIQLGNLFYDALKKQGEE
jgi:hypothetical protein